MLQNHFQFSMLSSNTNISELQAGSAWPIYQSYPEPKGRSKGVNRIQVARTNHSCDSLRIVDNNNVEIEANNVFFLER